MRFQILLEDLEICAIIGILEKERQIPQKILLHGEFEYEGKEGEYLDYVLLRDFIVAHIKESRYLLLEYALRDLATAIKSRFPALLSCALSIKKPDILQDCVIGLRGFFKFS
ncbi:dihydroneopterin aldolase [Helicobacter mustelae]|uniref:Putative dihydroneopterin aldolase n=1 Tax=Helicobacter mustelae (strain ATCC 43772 / CCUG 25715 / CIP 103759 / LMG 18044 / NCTC 12198 / R85-136P) TaxID=679897 RepID=D3UFR4_HELM1|nr:dihydroneopterin aldolase [Helicobacter mustelae]CBG39335.1 Putative dihydroneopterin aldolase [Helicobacter mustelae 12198]SQH70847.1 dihydroneopterin aldolase [Helicobacter mustelae]STP11973.1 dihydroneopterin aldolase [Helicobacter mustelae]